MLIHAVCLSVALAAVLWLLWLCVFVHEWRAVIGPVIQLLADKNLWERQYWDVLVSLLLLVLLLFSGYRALHLIFSVLCFWDMLLVYNNEGDHISKKNLEISGNFAVVREKILSF